MLPTTCAKVPLTIRDALEVSLQMRTDGRGRQSEFRQASNDASSANVTTNHWFLSSSGSEQFQNPEPGASSADELDLKLFATSSPCSDEELLLH